jgi:hypothetical protein
MYAYRDFYLVRQEICCIMGNENVDASTATQPHPLALTVCGLACATVSAHCMYRVPRPPYSVLRIVYYYTPLHYCTRLVGSLGTPSHQQRRITIR